MANCHICLLVNTDLIEPDFFYFIFFFKGGHFPLHYSEIFKFEKLFVTSTNGFLELVHNASSKE